MLIERDAELAVLSAAVDEATSRHGRLVFVSGEAGVGKTALVAAAARQAAERARVLRGVFDNVTTPAALGALIDASPELAELIDAESDNRPLLFRKVRAALTSTPTVLVLEDVQWADEATLDLLRFLGRRLDGIPVLIVVTYRSDEVTRRHPLAIVLGDLAPESAVSRLAVEPLTAEGVAELVASASGAVDARALHERTGGNAFYVTEVLAAPDRDVPNTVRDAVLARTMRLSADAQQVLAAAAVLGHPADPVLLVTVAGRELSAVDECTENGLLVVDRDRLTFRHDLARQAVEDTLLPGQLLTLHRDAFAALRTRASADDRRLAHHAAAAGERAAACRHATRAAQRAARLGAHREAVAQYRAALHFAGDDAVQRAALLVALSYECYLTDEAAESLAARRQAIELAELAGDRAALGEHQRWVSRLSWFLGRTADADRYAERAVSTLEPLGDSHALGMAYSNTAQLAMLAGDLERAETWGTVAIALAHRIGDREVEMHALNNVGTAGLQRNDAVEAGALLARSLDLALSDDAHEHVARAYTNLGSVAAVNRRLADAATHLRAGIRYCAERDLDSWTAYMAAQLAGVMCERGRHDETLTMARDVLRRPRLSPISTIVAATAAARAAARRGDDPHEWLDLAWKLAAATGETQRVVPAAAAYAESTWLAGEPPPVKILDAAWAASMARPAPWEVGEIAYWRVLGSLPVETATPLPEPFALMADGRWLDAARAWQQRDCAMWQAYALGHDPGLDSAREALELCSRLDAPAVWAALARDRHAAGLPVPRGPRAARATNPAGLTTRELEILQLLAAGLSNPAIGDRLFVSTRTVDHHVSAVLRKLGQPNRAHAVATAIQRGWIDPPI